MSRADRDKARRLLDRAKQPNPVHQAVQPLANSHGTLRMTLMNEAAEAEEIDTDDPRRLDQWYFPDEGCVLIDLRGGNNE